MRAGRLKHPITFVQKTATRDAMGGEVITWVDYADDWAEVVPLRGREYFAARQMEAAADVRFRVRYRDDIEAYWRIRWRTDLYEIVDVINVEADDRATEMMCRSVPT